MSVSTVMSSYVHAYLGWEVSYAYMIVIYLALKYTFQYMKSVFVNFLQIFVPRQLQKGTPLSISLPATILIMITIQLQGRILMVIMAKLLQEIIAETPLKKS